MSNKSRGIQTEREAQKELESLGYSAVRSRGSFGAFDVIAWNKDVVRFVQVKREKAKWNKRTSYKKVIEELEKIELPCNTTKELWVRRDKDSKFHVLYKVENKEIKLEETTIQPMES